MKSVNLSVLLVVLSSLPLTACDKKTTDGEIETRLPYGQVEATPDYTIHLHRTGVGGQYCYTLIENVTKKAAGFQCTP